MTKHSRLSMGKLQFQKSRDILEVTHYSQSDFQKSKKETLCVPPPTAKVNHAIN